MTEPTRTHPRLQVRDRVLVAVTRGTTRALFRSVEVVGDPPPPGPTILAASHLNGFVDPVVLLAQIGHLPRFLAKATLWTNPAAKVGLNFARVIPVHRAVDGSTEANTTMFASAVDALEHHATLAVFAEGTTHDDPTIRPLRTGVARIALEAAGEGIESIQVVPVGITYEDKVALRGRVLIDYGAPIGVPADPELIGPDGTPSHEKVRVFTDHLQHRVEALTPHFASTEEALALTTAATIDQRTTTPANKPVPMAKIAHEARTLAATRPEDRQDLVTRVARYEMLRGFVGLDDATVLSGIRLADLTRRIVVLGIIVFVLSPLAVAGLFANLVPFVLVTITGLFPKAPVSKGTARVLVGLITFPATWLFLALADAGTGALGSVARAVTLPVNGLLGPLPADRAGGWAALLVFVAVPVMGVLAMFVISRAWALFVAILRWRTLLDRRGQLDLVRAHRDDVVATTRAMVAGADGPTR